MAKETAYIGLGSNLGDRRANISGAVKMLAGAEQIELVRVSDIVETTPLGQVNQSKYLNAVAELKTTLGAADLHKKLLDIETSLCRVRQKRWSPRTIDLDLLLFGDEIVSTPDLAVPHRQMHMRSFVLNGLCQLNGDLTHPVMDVSVSELASRLSGCDFFLDSSRPQLVSVAGIIGVGKTTLAKKLAGQLDCEVLFEPYDANPFMPEVYAGRTELALDSQLFFLTNRKEQLDKDSLGKAQIFISDYVFNKELIYARRLLDAQQLAMYEGVYPPFAAQVASPVLVIYMRDSASNCLERIRRRSRPYEQQIELQFLRDLDDDYERLFEPWKACPVIRVSTAAANDIGHLARQVKCYVVEKSAQEVGPKPSKAVSADT